MVALLSHREKRTDLPHAQNADPSASSTSPCSTEQTHTFNNTRITRLVRRVGYALLPQPLRSRIYHEDHEADPRRSTSWLDGMRGYAAIVIFNFHFLSAYSDMSQRPWGDEKHRYLVELPIIRWVYGQMPPYIFFIAAGYALSIKPLQLMRAGDRDKLLQVMSGSIFRRIVRLFLPTITVMMITSCLSYAGAFEPARLYVSQPQKYFPGQPGRPKTIPPRFPTMGEQWTDFRAELSSIMNFFSWHHYYPALNGPLWTIRVEVRSSLILYAILLVFSQCKSWVRLGGLVWCLHYCVRWEKMDEAAYFWGAIVAQMDVIRQPDSDKGASKAFTVVDASRTNFMILDSLRMLWAEMLESERPRMKGLRRCITAACLLGPFYLMTCPSKESNSAPGYATLISMVPEGIKEKGQSLCLLGNFIMVILCSWFPPNSALHLSFANPLALYLGKIMFGIYLVHYPILTMGILWIPHAIWNVLGDPSESLLVYVAGLAGGWIVGFTVTWWIADVFTREVLARIFMVAFYLETIFYDRYA